LGTKANYAAFARIRRQNASDFSLRFERPEEKLCVRMQAQDTTTLFLLKLWPWVEANKNRLIAGAAIAVLAIFIIWFVACQRESKEIAAGQALTQVLLSSGGPSAAAYLKIAEQHAGTAAGQRALLQGAAALFDAGKYPDAQTQFQKFLDAHPDSEFSGQAALGVAASLDAQG